MDKESGRISNSAQHKIKILVHMRERKTNRTVGTITPIVNSMYYVISNKQ